MLKFMGRILSASTAGAQALVKNLQTPGTRGQWSPIVREAFTGAWQRNIEIHQDTVLAYSAVFACMTLIAGDVSKLGVRLVVASEGGVWLETSNPAYSPVLRKPSPNQTRIQFFENWILSKLTQGNTYVLKVRDARGVVASLRILDPRTVTPMVADDGSVFYQLATDNFAGVESKDAVLVPADEIIHDRFNCIFHPLVGVSPIFACGLAATQGTYIAQNTTRLYANGAKAPGILTAPGAIGPETAQRLKEHWEANYTGESNFNKVAVLGDGLQYQAMSITAADSQLIEQLKWTAETVCSTFHVPPYKIGAAAMPAYNNVQAGNVEYYNSCLQVLIESIELCLDEGLNLPTYLGIEIDVDGLLRMDTAALITSLKEATTGGLMKPNEARRKLSLSPVTGGDAVFLQQQNFSLAALAKRDAKADPFGSSTSAPKPAETTPAATEEPAKSIDEDDDTLDVLLYRLQSFTKELVN